MALRIIVWLVTACALSGCGSMANVGPFYQDVGVQCHDAGQAKSCDEDSSNLAFTKDKLQKYSKHFIKQVRERANSNLAAGNVGLTASLLGVVAAAARSRDGILGAAALGIPPTLFAQRYNLGGQTQIYLRGARNFQCLSFSVAGLDAFPALYARVPVVDRLAELNEARATYEALPREVDRRIGGVIIRTESDLIAGVTAVDTAMVTSAFERYAADLKTAQEKVNFASLYMSPPTVAAAGLSDEEKSRLKDLSVRLKASSAELDKCLGV